MAKVFTEDQFRSVMASFDNGVLNAAKKGVDFGMRVALKFAVTEFMKGGGKNAPVLPDKLRIRSGKLRRSVRIIKARRVTDLITAGLQAGGAGVPYARIHELGGTIRHPGSVPRKAKVLRWFDSGGNPVFSAGTRAHTISIPKRPYLSPAIKKAEPHIAAAVDGAIQGLVLRILGPN